MNKITITQGHTYIFKQLGTNYPSIRKGKVLEITETTYYIHWEEGNKARYLITTFGFEAIEDMGIEEVSELFFFGDFGKKAIALDEIQTQALNETIERLVKTERTIDKNPVKVNYITEQKNEQIRVEKTSYEDTPH